MKVLFVVANHPPEALGGTEQVVVALTRELTALGVSCAVVSGSDVPHAGVDALEEGHAGVPVVRVPRRPDERDQHGFVRPRLLALLQAQIAHHRPDVVHVHSFAHFGTGIAALCRAAGAPMVVTCHDLWVTCARYFRLPAPGLTCPRGSERGPCVPCVQTVLPADAATIAAALAERDRLLRAEFAAAAAVTTPSATAAAFVRECLPFPGPIDVIPHGLLHAVPPAHRAPAPAPGERLRVGTFGGLVRSKGLVELLDAVAGLPCELHLTGRLHEPDLQALVDERQRRGLPVVWRGTWGPADRHPARDLHLAVFPSKCQETYGLVVDEALAHGVPTVVSDAGALAERAATPGVVVTPLSALAPTLRELVGSPSRLAALRAAIPATLPTIALSAQRHLALYRRLR
ncbi:MAG: glycosyltransferase [Planctomycetota bacterium]|jgi:glycosyltransferase involved in cell wall biosynthesis